ncbi:hypothetical protein SEA_DRE3_64 [Gordonia phage Dre3]|uniref:Uncharacterized protein n=1 Tax=Gordonia phage Gibbous TaxID=2652405 RepID=A0A5J6T6Z6_9CAUD|nr:hypothetical protein QLQ74_gp64 [Gordonia phage Gibbous]QFG05140.1 hypothetical protein SEA_GIBBOUS_64 [Gordonia phage Gibbous]QRI45993.1 hypothetical protein SEA_DRE3_64 [Gordonia phage Dre3]
MTTEEFRLFMANEMGITPAEDPNCDPLYVATEAMRAMKRAFQQVSQYVEMMAQGEGGK